MDASTSTSGTKAVTSWAWLDAAASASGSAPASHSSALVSQCSGCARAPGSELIEESSHRPGSAQASAPAMSDAQASTTAARTAAIGGVRSSFRSHRKSGSRISPNSPVVTSS
eukprot:5892925-Prymnesium_polylepis.1